MNCLYCYKPLLQQEKDFHLLCSKKFFGSQIAPEFPYSENQMIELAEQVVRSQTTVTGVQPKISVNISSDINENGQKRFTIMGLYGGYILKPPFNKYPHLPEIEDLTMHLAAIAKLKVVPHSLIRLESGSLAYITKRIDRINNKKLHMEDMCQLTERLTEDKYHGSNEQVAKAILKYSTNPVLDVINFFEQVLFSFLTGNADMHLKNFSLIQLPKIGHVLSPAYDMVATTLINPADDEDLALTLNGKKKKIIKDDFVKAFNTSKLDQKQQENMFNKMLKAKDNWMNFIDISFLNDAYKSDYKKLIIERFNRLSL